jgi:uncharacterized protein (DUF1499 family)
MLSKIIKYAVIILVLLSIAFCVKLYFESKKGADMKPNIGLEGMKLKPCPEKPNCVCSQVDESDSHYIDPLQDTNIENIKQVLSSLSNCTVVSQSGDYIHATFKSKLFGFIDDVEFLMDGTTVQVRSASRVGHSDMGANKKRIENIRKQL